MIKWRKHSGVAWNSEIGTPTYLHYLYYGYGYSFSTPWYSKDAGVSEAAAVSAAVHVAKDGADQKSLKM